MRSGHKYRLGAPAHARTATERQVFVAVGNCWAKPLPFIPPYSHVNSKMRCRKYRVIDFGRTKRDMWPPQTCQAAVQTPNLLVGSQVWNDHDHRVRSIPQCSYLPGQIRGWGAISMFQPVRLYKIVWNGGLIAWGPVNAGVANVEGWGNALHLARSWLLHWSGGRWRAPEWAWCFWTLEPHSQTMSNCFLSMDIMYMDTDIDSFNTPSLWLNPPQRIPNQYGKQLISPWFRWWIVCTCVGRSCHIMPLWMESAPWQPLPGAFSWVTNRYTNSN